MRSVLDRARWLLVSPSSRKISPRRLLSPHRSILARSPLIHRRISPLLPRSLHFQYAPAVFEICSPLRSKHDYPAICCSSPLRPVQQQQRAYHQLRAYKSVGFSSGQLCRFLLQKMGKAIAFLLKHASSLLGVGHENLVFLANLHTELMTGNGMTAKMYRYLLKHFSSRFEEVLDGNLDKVEAKSTVKLMQIIARIKAFFGFKEQKKKDEEQKGQDDTEQKNKEEQRGENDKEDEKKQKEKAEKNPKKSVVLTIELYDMEEVDETLRMVMWNFLKSKNVSAIKIKKKE